MKSGLYTGRVVHERLRPKRHRLAYKVFCLLVDLDELDEIDRRFGRLLAVNRPGLFSFHERDHGAGEGSLRDWATARLAEAGIDFDGGRIELLCYPRILGFTFNPLSVYFCYRQSGELAGLLYEVHNTHGERHTYVMPAGPERVVRHAARKTFFVSPFMPMDCVYRFRIAPPGRRVGVSILEDDAEGLLLTASFTGERQELGRSELLRMFWRYPLMTIKVVAGIHWEAIKLLAKGFRVFHHRRAVRRIDASAPLAAATPEARRPEEVAP